MSWPIGYAVPGVAYRMSEKGALSVNGVEVTDERGWLDLPTPDGLDTITVRVRIKVAPDAYGAAYFYAEEALVGEKWFSSVHRLAMMEGSGWIVFLARTIPREVQRRAQSRTPGSRSGTVQVERPTTRPLVEDTREVPVFDREALAARQGPRK